MKSTLITRVLLIGAATASLTACNLEDYLKGKLDSLDQEKIRYVASGVISSLNDFTVNGIRFNTDNAQVTLNDQNGNQSDLNVGMYVTVKGTVDSSGKNGDASTISFESEIDGVVSANNITVDGTLEVMGQTVHVDNTTRFYSELAAIATMQDIRANNYVEVSGYSTGNGQIFATYIEVKADSYLAGDELSVKGTVTNLTADGFQVGDLSISYDNAYLDDFGGRQLEEGMYVRIKTTAQVTDSSIDADHIRLEGQYHDSSESAEIQGIVSEISDGSFKVNNVVVHYDGNTYFHNGSAATLTTGQMIEVEGNYDSNGDFLANEVGSGDEENEANDDDRRANAYENESESGESEHGNDD